MSSGFTGGGPDFYGGGGARSAAMNNTQQSQYRSRIPGILLDPASQIINRRPDLMGKRSLADLERQYQQQQQLQQQGLNLFLRSVKQRTYQHTSPISPLSPVDFSPNPISPDAAAASSVSTRYGIPLLHQHRPQPLPMMFNNTSNSISNSSCNSSNLSTVSYTNYAPNRVDLEQDSEKMRNRLEELEKQLLDDNDIEDGDAVSVITGNEWSEIQNLISPTTLKPVSPSPTTSSTSSCSSSSASPPSQVCSKQLLIDAALAIYERNTETAMEILTRLNQVVNVRGNSEQRLTAYVSLALKSRFSPSDYPPPVTELFGKEQMTATQLLYDLSPCFKLGFVAANLAILETLTSSSDKKQLQPQQLHVVDFDIGQGSQYYHLIHALSTRCQSKSSVILKITAVNSDSTSCKDVAFLNSVGESLKELALSVGVTIHFRVVTQRISELTRDTLGCEDDESLAVNLAFVLHQMPDESVTTENPRDELLRRVKGLKPEVVTMVEQEMNANTAPFMVRVKEVVSYYGALFESLDCSGLSREDGKRVRLEEGLSRRMSNSVACEGRDRVERCEVLGKWRARMGMAGFEPKPMSPQAANTMRAGLSSTSTTTASPTRGSGRHCFSVKEDGGCICFGWMGRVLTVASAWR
ncbi:Transcription factor GRAS [Dillenia turbinata]|uniref:Transcription factor GRAS n=1 Tax=Dillenia turbinata TaxID=194707 RepID=A0AAN8VAK9_9MAGN